MSDSPDLTQKNKKFPQTTSTLYTSGGWRTHRAAQASTAN